MRLPLLDLSDGESLDKASHNTGFSAPLSARHMSENDYFQNIVQLLFPPEVCIRNMHRHPTRVHRVIQLELSNGHHLIVKLAPLPAVPLLRMERLSLETEARALTLLANLGNPCIPKLFRFIPQYPSSGASVLVRQYVNGTPLLEMQDQLSLEDYRDLDSQLGSLTKAVSQETSTAFGPLNKVATGAGSSSWRESFLSLFEEVLRDAEDMMIHLPYDQIRREVPRLSPALDEITVPHLVIVKLGRPSEVLLDPDLKQLSGTLGLGSTIWGDVLMAELFESPSDAFLAGFGLAPPSGKHQAIRSMLYSSYRHVYKITELYYRGSNSTSEMHARRRLTNILESMALTELV